MGTIEGGTKREVRRDHRAVFGPERWRRIRVLLTVTVCANTAVQCAVPFSTGHGDGTPFLAPMVMIVSLSYYLIRVVLKAVTKGPSGSTMEVPDGPGAPPNVR
ncbi:MAG: hypothetical protein JNL43_10350 [Flavobacteriales bacterium]|nr:hypothetical protein [Flavobacteriales bacterium]